MPVRLIWIRRFLTSAPLWLVVAFVPIFLDALFTLAHALIVADQLPVT
ncbi:hypothetical protein [Amycolatopsis cihanbeyliensis]|uniref:Uncharacterized protein n=1 Tax=Amycolatopsis cihanbeyliensis TaxID=1128664 RepID=A0A542CUY5_AMYCI|nr:hypothetical protein [Amycolatopsis cihanbeyliensis]TQI94629.1 hypothetical protein FB471_6798 [Amycolatopsis cihanbeyliensis]